MSDSNLTKKALAAALKQIMTEVPFPKISVGDICEACGMSRKSFYYHFKDKYDLVNWIFYTEFVETIGAPNVSSAWNLFASVCLYFYQERTFYRSALRIEGQNSFNSFFREVMTPLLLNLTQELYTSEETSEFFLDFFIDAFLAAIIRWLTKEPIAPAELFLNRMRDVLIGLAKITMKELADNPEDEKSIHLS